MPDSYTSFGTVTPGHLFPLPQFIDALADPWVFRHTTTDTTLLYILGIHVGLLQTVRSYTGALIGIQY